MFLLQDSTTEAASHANYVTDCVSYCVNSAFNAACFKQGVVINDQ